MTPYLQAENLMKRYGDLLLFENISFTINKDQKVALIARNGAGKTTLFDLLAGIDSPDAGTITWTRDISFGYLGQNPCLNPDHSVMEEIFSTENERMEILRAYETALLRHDAEKIISLSALMDQLNIWDIEVEIKQILTRLKIPDLETKVRELSGGQQKRLGLAKVLIGKPDFLLLDEPTNHLDLSMIEWLENYLIRSKSTLLMITHDRYFLDRVCDEILEIDNSEVFRYRGNYSYFLEKREERIQAQQSGIARAQNILRKEIEWMRRMPQARSHKARYRIDAFYDLQERAKDRLSDRVANLDVPNARLGKKIMEIHNLSKSYGKQKLIHDFNYTFSKYEKVGIAGDNGTGKTTFLELITGRIRPDTGRTEVGQTVRFGYYRQDGISFNPGDKVLDAVNKIAESFKREDGTMLSSSQMLTRFLFPPSQQYDFIEKLSGGEKRRLYLCSVLMQNPNFLILDEPTNDLDILTLNVLEEYLQAFEGCVVIVSHDRFFMDKIVDHLFVFSGDGRIRDYPGNYTQYRNHLETEESPVKSRKKESNIRTREKPVQEGKSKLTFKEKRELGELEKEIHQLEQRKSLLEDSLNSGALGHEELYKASKEIGEVSEELEEKEMRWIELSEAEG
jgi:ATP-binding cassette subfamily F protein uup